MPDKDIKDIKDDELGDEVSQKEDKKEDPRKDDSKKDASPKADKQKEAVRVSTDKTYKVEFIESVKFRYAGVIYDKKLGEEMQVNDILFDILTKRKCIRLKR